MREIRPSGSLSGEWKRRHGRIFWHWQPKGPATRMADLNPPRHSSTLLVSDGSCGMLGSWRVCRFCWIIRLRIPPGKTFGEFCGFRQLAGSFCRSFWVGGPVKVSLVR